MQSVLPFHLENFIGGNFIGPLSGRFIDNINPATGEVYGQIPDSNEKDVNIAVSAARKAYGNWSTTSAEKKFSILNKIADLIDANSEALALAETNDNGKPLWLSKKSRHLSCCCQLPFFCHRSHAFFSREPFNGRQSDQLYTPAADRNCRLHFTMEPPLISFHLENCTRPCCR